MGFWNETKKSSHNFSSFCSDGDRVITSSQVHSRIQVGRDLRKFLFQLLAQSSDRPGCSGLCPLTSCKPPGTETAQPPRATCSTARLSSWAKNFLTTSSLYLPCFTLSPLPLILPPCPMWRAWLHHLLTSPQVPGLPSGPLQPSLLQAEQALVPQPPFTGQALQPATSGGDVHRTFTELTSVY